MDEKDKSREDLIIELGELRLELDQAKKSFSNDLSIRNDLDFKLKERLKELHCHNRISHFMANDDLSFSDTLKQIVGIIPDAWQFPEVTSASIDIKGLVYKTENFRMTSWYLLRDIVTSGKTIGRVIVCYNENCGFDPASPFLKEEEDLIFAIAERLGNFVQRKEKELALYQSEEKYRELIENIHDVIYEIDPKGVIKYISPSVERIVGFSPKEVIGKNFTDFVGEAGKFLSERLLLLKDVHEIENEYKIRSKTGVTCWVRLSTKAKFDGKDFIGGTGTLIDITDRKQIDLELQNSESLYRSILDASPDLITITDLEGKILLTSPRAFELFGYDNSFNFGGHSLLEYIHPEDHVRAMQGITDMFRGNFFGATEYKGIRADGSIFDIEVNGQFIRDAEGNPVSMIFVTRDISERKKTESMLFRTEERFRKLVENINDAIYEIDNTGTVLYVSPSIERIVGYTPEDLIGKNFFAFMYPDDRPILTEALAHLGQKDFSFLEYRYYAKDGSLRWVRSSTKPIVQNGSMIGGIGSLTDITDRKKDEEELLKLSRAVEQSPVSIVITNLDGNIEYANPKATETTGYELHELLGKNPRVLKSGETNSMEYEKLWKTITTGDKWHGIFHNKRKNGELYWESSTISPITDLNGKITHYRAVKEDITERIKTQQILIKSEATLNYAQEIAKMGSWELDLSTNEVIWSKNLFRLLGLEPAEKVLDNNAFNKMVHPDDYHLVDDLMEEMSKTHQAGSIDLRIVMPDGSFKWIQDNVVPVYDGGELISLKGVNIDITEKKLAEEEIKQQNARSNAIFQALPDLILISDKDGVCIEYYTNDPKRIPVPRDQIIGIHVSKIYEPKIADLHLQKIKECIATEKVVTYEYDTTRNSEEYHYETRLVRMGPDRVLAFIRDITDKKQKEEEIQKLSMAVDQSPVSIVITDLDANIEYVNPAFTTTTGYTMEEVIGKNTNILKSGLTPRQTYDELWDTLRQGKGWSGEWINNRKNGETYWESISISPIHDEKGNVINYLAVKQDITHRKQIEQEIRDLNATLEQRIEERTTQLSVTNENLLQEIEERRQIEEALQEKTQELENFFNVALDLLCIADTSGYFIRVNKAWENLLGYSTAELEHRQFLEFVHPDDIQATLDAMNELSEQNPILNFINRYRTKEGDYRFIEWHSVPVGSFIYAAARDITERMIAETLLEQTRQNYATFFNTIDDFLFVLDSRGIIIDVNETVIVRLGYGPTGLTGKKYDHLYPNDRLAEVVGEMKGMLAGTIELSSVPILTKNGDQIPVETRVKRGHWNGQEVYFIVSKDISKIKLSEQKFSTAFQSNSAMMAISNFENGEYLDINNAFLEVMGYTRQEIIGNTNLGLQLFVDLNLRKRILDTLDAAIPVRKWEIKIRTKDGVEKTGLLSADSIFIGDIRCLLTVNIDISDRIKAEEDLRQARLAAEQANLAKSEFLSRMSLELRTPMNSILGFAQLLEMGELNAGQKKGVTHIMRSGKHLLDLINEVLDISRIEAGRLSLSLEPVDVDGLIGEMLDYIKPQAFDRNIKMKIISSPESKLFVKSDRQRLKQVLLNLLSNAVKYNREGGWIHVETELTDAGYAGKENLRISVSDSGLGISPADLPKLFTPFERIGAEKTETEGTGLGLSVVKKLMEAMGGFMGVSSVVGEGSTFWIELPVIESQIETAINGGDLINIKPDIPANAGTILYIEDNNSNIELVEQLLSVHRPGIKLIADIHGRQAVALARQHKPDIILLDLNLPDIHGSEVLRRLLADEKVKSIPVVIISADATPKQYLKLIREGARKYLTKPLEIAELLKVIDETFGC